MFDPQKPHICGSGITLIKNTILPVVGTGGRSGGGYAGILSRLCELWRMNIFVLLLSALRFRGDGRARYWSEVPTYNCCVSLTPHEEGHNCCLVLLALLL